MTIRYLSILLLPVILHSKGNTAVLVFLIMNSIISVLMEYTKIEIKMLGHMIENRDKIEKLLNDGHNQRDGSSGWAIKLKDNQGDGSSG